MSLQIENQPGDNVVYRDNVVSGQKQPENIVKCKHNFNLICDNDCGTTECSKCHLEHYCVDGIDSAGLRFSVCSEGHNPKCGQDSEGDFEEPEELSALP